MPTSNKPEILSPVGDMEKLRTAVHFGADAVYLGGRGFNLRAGAGNFDPPQLREAVAYAHERGVKVYVTANAFVFENDLDGMRTYLKESVQAGADAFIVSDPGVFSLAREIAPDTAIHVSTQANTTNAEAVKFWHKLGAKRVILARECALEEIRRIRAHTPAEVELEAFVHGAMCVAYSGRCLLSQYLLARGANQGDCAQPCRYLYHVMEETRPGQYLPVIEDGHGTAVFSAGDLCMAEYLPELIAAGISSFKIEGRMKSPFYVGLTTSVYRRALDTYRADPRRYEVQKAQYTAELEKCAHRAAAGHGYTTGFYFGKPSPSGAGRSQGILLAHAAGAADITQRGIFVGVVLDYNAQTGYALVEQRNKFSVGDELQMIRGQEESFAQIVTDMRDADGAALYQRAETSSTRKNINVGSKSFPKKTAWKIFSFPSINSAPHPQQRVYLKMDKPVEAHDLIWKNV